MTCKRYFDVDVVDECWGWVDVNDGVGDRLSASGKVVDAEEGGIVGEVGASVNA